MKRWLVIGAACFIVITFAVGIWWHHYDELFENFPEKTLQSTTGIHDFDVLQKEHNDYEWFITVHLHGDDGPRFLQTHTLTAGRWDSSLAGKIRPPQYVPDGNDCWYSVDMHSQGTYGYLLMVLSPDKQILSEYQFFGD